MQMNTICKAYFVILQRNEQFQLYYNSFAGLAEN
jgi:hypothetical protein